MTQSYQHELIPGPDINFSDIRDLFDPSLWDVGYLDETGFRRASTSPIKSKLHQQGYDATENFHNNVWNGIVLARHANTTNDYSFYEEAEKILLTKFANSSFVFTYTNFKEASILSGMGVRAKNSLIYNRKFGFQSKICSFMFVHKITNTPDVKPNRGLLDLCDDCSDCIKNCPVGAIHEDWVDAKSCDNHIGENILWYWYEKMQPDISREEVESWKTWDSTPPLEWGQGVDGFYERDGWKLKKDGVVIPIPHCRECTLQPKCSKAPCLTE